MDGDSDGSSSSDDVSPTDLYFTEDEDALHRLHVRARRRRRRRRRRTTRVRLDQEDDDDDDDHHDDDDFFILDAAPAPGGVAIACLPETTTTVGEARESEQCAVCLDEYEAGDELRTMPCGHGFHERCIVEWLCACPLCPLCRFQLPAEEEDTETDEEEDEREAAEDDDHDGGGGGGALEYLYDSCSYV